MEGLVQPDRLCARILMWAEEELGRGLLPPQAGKILEALLYRGELPRGDAGAITATGERQARRIVSGWIPGLFPDQICLKQLAPAKSI